MLHEIYLFIRVKSDLYTLYRFVPIGMLRIIDLSDRYARSVSQ
jgi:hypothetical protein